MPSKQKLIKAIKGLIKHALRGRDFVIDLVFPIECLGCGEEKEWLCPRCFKLIALKSGQYCLHCKAPKRYGEFCQSCQPLYGLNGVWIAGDYEDKLLSAIIKNLKYRFARDLSVVLGDFLTLFLKNFIARSRFSSQDVGEENIWRKFKTIKQSPDILLDFSHSVIIPVPLHNKRRRWRGFNQAEEIAATVANCFSLPLVLNRLIRIKHRPPQAKLKENERQSSVRGIFAWSGGPLNSRNIILIDDVVTTGSTLNECARVLKKNGAGEVWGLVAAKG
jgi:ComF family protein